MKAKSMLLATAVVAVAAFCAGCSGMEGEYAAAPLAGASSVDEGSRAWAGSLSAPYASSSPYGVMDASVGSLPTASQRSGTRAGSLGALGVNRYDMDSLANPYGAGSPYKVDGLMNPYSRNGSRYSNTSWRNPYATDAPKLYDSRGVYRGKLSSNPYDPDSTSNPYGRYGSKYSPDSINNPYGAGNPYANRPIYVFPSR